MTEVVGFLYKIASLLSHKPNDNSQRILESYYLMRCKDITKGHGLPVKYFSPSVRCSNCCLEWKKGTKTLVKPGKLSKKQRRRFRSQLKTKTKKDNTQNRPDLLQCNKIEHVCPFCKKTTVVTALKPKYDTEVIDGKKKEPLPENTLSETIEKKPSKTVKHEPKVKSVNVYSQSKDVFSLHNERNVLASTKKEPLKIIKNNKKKKDKFAGLCQKAVLASAQLKAEKEKDKESKKDKLHLFLRQSL